MLQALRNEEDVRGRDQTNVSVHVSKDECMPEKCDYGDFTAYAQDEDMNMTRG